VFAGFPFCVRSVSPEYNRGCLQTVSEDLVCHT